MEHTLKEINKILIGQGYSDIVKLLRYATLEIDTYPEETSPGEVTTITSAIIYTDPLALNTISKMPSEDIDKISNAIFKAYPDLKDIPEGNLKIGFHFKNYDKGLNGFDGVLDIAQDLLHLEKASKNPNYADRDLIDDRYTIHTLKDFEKQIKKAKEINGPHEIHFQNEFIESFPKDFLELDQLVTLRLINCKIKNFPKDFSKLVALESVVIKNVIIDSLPNHIIFPPKLWNFEYIVTARAKEALDFDKISKFTKITELRLEGNNLVAIPESIGNLVHLTSLHLENNQLDSLPHSFNKLQSLTSLDLSHNKFVTIPKSIPELTSLQVLVLNYNQLEEIPSSISKLTNLSLLLLVNNKLTDLPTSLTELRKLQSIHLDLNPFKDNIIGRGVVDLFDYLQRKEINKKDFNLDQGRANPQEIIEYSGEDEDLEMVDDHYFVLTEERFQQQIDRNKRLNQTYFEFEGEYIPSFPTNFWELTHLTSLTFKDCKIESIPPDISKLHNLTFLEIEISVVPALPPELTLPNQLTYLILLGISLSEVPNQIENLSNLISLNLSGNQITVLPEFLFNLTSLESLQFDENLILELPSNIAKLSKLRTLSLESNQIEKLPVELCEMTNLEGLFLHSNNLTRLPSDISKMHQLVELQLDNNKLVALPCSITALRKTSLTLEDNPFDEMPEIIGMNQLQLYYYLDEKKSERRHVTHWEVHEKLRISFQQYLNFFSEFVERLSGETIMFEVVKSENGLKLTTEPTGSLTIQDIDTYLSLYMEQTKKVELESGIDRLQQLEARRMQRDWLSEKQLLNHRIERLLDNIAFLKESNEEKKKAIEELRLTTRYFQDQAPHHLRIIENLSNTSNKILAEYIPSNRKYEAQIIYLEELKEEILIDLSLASAQRVNAHIAIADMIDELKADSKPKESKIKQLAEILKTTKAAGGLIKMVWELWGKST